MRKYFRTRLLELIPTIREGITYGMTKECDEALESIRKSLRDNLSADGFSKYEGNLVIDKLDILEDLLRHEKEVRKEVVFFPYNVKMWDSLESIWLAAKDDPACFVSVVPIPYYTVENEKPIMHYDGNNYPDYVPITDWQAYDLDLMRPDVAYVHNVYDNRNFVTMVEPRYFTRNLKKYVDLLVYVPYFVNQANVSEIFAIPAAHSAADILIASSSIDANDYLGAGAKMDVAALGSPKTDKIFAMENKKPQLPPEWHILNNKKIFLITTGIGFMLSNTINYFAKMYEVLEVFGSRDDIALIWQPHSLTEATIKTLRPAIMEQYEEIKRLIIDKSLGVLDDLPDMSKAIEVSDAFIGDAASTISCLYALTGKPMCAVDFSLMGVSDEIQNEMLQSDIIYWSNQTEGSEKWGVCREVNALCAIDLETAEARFVSSLPDDRNIGRLYSSPIRVGNKLLLSPYYARKWAIYDIENGVWETYPIPDVAMPELDTSRAFGNGVNCGNSIIFIPGESGIVARYDLNSGEFAFYTEISDKFKDRIMDLSLARAGDCCKVNEFVYITFLNCNTVVEINTDKMEFQFFEVGDEKNAYYGITYDGHLFWMTKYRKHGKRPWSEGIISWNRQTLEACEYTDPLLKQDSTFNRGGFSFIRSAAGSVFAFPNQAKEIIKIDPENGKMEPFPLDPPFDYFEDTMQCYTWFNKYALGVVTDPLEDKVVVTVPSGYGIMTIDLKTGKRSGIKKWKIKGIEHLLKRIDRIIPLYHWESIFLRPKDFVDKVVSGEYPAVDEAQKKYARLLSNNSDGTCGAKVHNYVMGKLK